MKILDRYLLLSLLTPLLFCLGAFFCLWIIFDLFDIVGDLVKQKASLWFILQYYGVQMPKIAQIILPPSFFFSCVYVLAYMSARRELVATMAAGVSLARIAVPFFIMSLVVACVQYALYFDLTPNAKKRVDALEKQLSNKEGTAEIYRGVVFKNPVNGTMWYVSEINITERTFQQAEILSIDELGRDKEKLFVASGKFKGDYWDLFNIRKVVFDPQGLAKKPVDMTQLDALYLNESPEDMIATLRPPEQYPWLELYHFTHAKFRPSPNRMAPYHMEYHYRMAYPLICPVLCLFAFAFAISFNHSARNSSLMACLLVLFGLLVFVNISVALGNSKRLSPAFAAWSTIIFFGSAGLWLFANKVGWFWDARSILQANFPLNTSPIPSSDPFSDPSSDPFSEPLAEDPVVSDELSDLSEKPNSSDNPNNS